MQRGDYAGAVPVLQQAVAAYPSDATDAELRATPCSTWAAHCARPGGRARRYRSWSAGWPSPTRRKTVQKELDKARKEAKKKEKKENGGG